MVPSSRATESSMDDLLAILSSLAPWLAAAAGIAVAALANGMETGIYRINRIRLRLKADAGNRRAQALVRLLGDVRGLIVVCLIGYNGGVYLTTAVVTTLVARFAGGESETGVEVLTTAILTPVFFVFTDVTPKSIFTYEADRWMFALTPILRGAYHVLRGIGLVPALKGVSTLVLRLAHGRGKVHANPFHPRQRLRAFLREGAAEGVITGYQDELVEKVLGLRERRVGQVMIPRARTTAVEVSTSREAFLDQLRGHRFSRLPVWEGRPDHVVGIVHIRDVIGTEGERPLAEVMTPDPVTVPPELPVARALFRMQRRRAPMALVQDPRGRVLGILTMKDLVEEIVGELPVW